MSSKDKAMMGHRDVSWHHNISDAALGSDHHGFKPGTRKWGKRIANRRVRAEPVRVDMYDQRAGGWLQPYETEETYFYLGFVPGEVEDKWDYFYD